MHHDEDRDESFNLKIGFHESILFDSNMGRVKVTSKCCILKLRENAHVHSISRSPKNVPVMLFGDLRFL